MQGQNSVSNYSCPWCPKTYQRKIYYNRHVLCCALLQSQKQAEIEKEKEEREDIPTIKELYGMVQELGMKYADMMEKMETMVRYINYQKRALQKIPLLKILNKTRIPSVSWILWFKNLSFKDNYLDLVFKYGLKEGIDWILNDIFDGSGSLSDTVIPLWAWENRKGVVFGYDGKEWVIIGKENIDYLCNFLGKRTNWSIYKMARCPYS